MNDFDRCFGGKTFEDLSHKASLALKAGKLAVFEWELKTDKCFADPLLRTIFDLPDGDLTGAMVLSRVLDEDRFALESAIQRTLIDNVDYDACFRVGTPNDFIWVGGRGRVVERDATGAPIRMMGVNWNMTQSKLQEERQKALIREMDHRVNKGYAIIKSIVAIGAEHFDCPPEFEKVLTTQIHALASAHQLAANFMLHEHANTRALSLAQAIEKSVRIIPSATLEMKLEPGLSILPQNVAPLCMALHHICMPARIDKRITIATRSISHDVCEFTWTSGDDTCRTNTPSAPDLLFELCVEQLNGSVEKFDSTADRQDIAFHIPVLSAKCHVRDGRCAEGKSCLQAGLCGYTSAPDRHA